MTTETNELTQLRQLDAFLEGEEVDLDDLRQEIIRARLRLGLPPSLSIDADPDLTSDPREEMRFFIRDLKDEASATRTPFKAQGGGCYAAADAADDDPGRRRACRPRKPGRQVAQSAWRQRCADRICRRSNDLPDRSRVHEACKRGSRRPRDRPGSIATPRGSGLERV